MTAQSCVAVQPRDTWAIRSAGVTAVTIVIPGADQTNLEKATLADRHLTIYFTLLTYLTPIQQGIKLSLNLWINHH